MAPRIPILLSTLLFSAMLGAGHAAELGEAQVRSYIGQALVADVELNLVEDPASKVQVRLANPDVYRGANIAMPPVLSSLNMTVTRRDGRQFLHLTSLKPVESRHLHVYLELVDGGQRSVRLVTLWLTPDPNPAPPPVQEAAPVPKAQALPVAPPKPLPAPVARPAAALQAGEEYVEAPAVVRKPVPKAVPVVKKAPPKKPAPVHAAPAAAPACAPEPASEHLNACAVLGEKNAALRQDLGELEDKVKALQGAAKPAPVAPVAHPAAPIVPPVAPAAPAAVHEARHDTAPAAPHEATPAPVVKEIPKDAPKGAPRIHRKPKKAEPPEPETPWLPIGAGIAAVLAIAALALALLRRRKHAGIGKIQAAHKPAKLPKAGKDAPVEEGEARPKFMEAVKARLMPGRAKGPAPEAAQDVEPVLTDVISQPE